MTYCTPVKYAMCVNTSISVARSQSVGLPSLGAHGKSITWAKVLASANQAANSGSVATRASVG